MSQRHAYLCRSTASQAYMAGMGRALVCCTWSYPYWSYPCEEARKYRPWFHEGVRTCTCSAKTQDTQIATLQRTTPPAATTTNTYTKNTPAPAHSIKHLRPTATHTNSLRNLSTHTQALQGYQIAARMQEERTERSRELQHEFFTLLFWLDWVWRRPDHRANGPNDESWNRR